MNNNKPSDENVTYTNLLHGQPGEMHNLTNASEKLLRYVVDFPQCTTFFIHKDLFVFIMDEEGYKPYRQDEHPCMLRDRWGHVYIIGQNAFTIGFVGVGD